MSGVREGRLGAVPFFDPPPPRILAHRGFARSAPENTVPAFEAAAALGITHMETDARLTADGVAVLWHDPDLQRWDGSADSIASLTHAELQERTVDGTTICSVAEALDALPSCRFNIDVKVPEATEAVIDAVEWVGATDRVLLTSRHERTARRLRARMPAAMHGASGPRIVVALIGIELRFEWLVARALKPVDAVQIPVRQVGLTLVSPKRLAAYKRHVREVHVWTVNDPTEMRRLVESGVDGIITDCVDRAVLLD